MEGFFRRSIMEVIKDIAAVVGVILSIITLLTLCTQAGRAAIKAIFKKNTQEIQEENRQQHEDIETIKTDLSSLLSKIDAMEEVSIQTCRNTIKEIYYKYQKQKKIPLYERKTADATHKIYVEKFHENSYEKLLYNEIIKWDIDTVSYEDYIQEKLCEEKED